MKERFSPTPIEIQIKSHHSDDDIEGLDLLSREVKFIKDNGYEETLDKLRVFIQGVYNGGELFLSPTEGGRYRGDSLDQGTTDRLYKILFPLIVNRKPKELPTATVVRYRGKKTI